MAFPTSTMPAGAWPNGYHVIEFTERMTNSGAEATVVFEGPSISRWDFLANYFTQWVLSSDPDEPCCYVSAAAIIPYVDYSYKAKEVGIIGEEWDCSELLANSRMYGDTFSISRGGSTCTPDAIPCLTTVNNAYLPLYHSDGSGGECSSLITINFRTKYHASFPTQFFGCDEDDYWRYPPVPTGTFIELEMSPSVQAKTSNKSNIHYDFSYKFPKLLNTGAADGTPCPSTANATVSQSQVCVADTPSAVDSDLTIGSYIFTTELVIKWTGVPLPPWSAIESLKGCVNETAWLGFPPGSVLLTAAIPTLKGQFFGVDLFDIEYQFSVSTAPVELHSAILADLASATPATVKAATETLLTYGIYKGQLGTWNRLWSDVAIVVPNAFCTNWVMTEVRDAVSCQPSACPSSSRLIHPLACFDELFSMTECQAP